MGKGLMEVPDFQANRRRQLLQDAFKLLAQPSAQPKRKKAITKKDILPLLVGGVGASALGADPGAIGKGLMAFTGTRQGLADQDFEDQRLRIGEDNRVREVQAKEKFALADIAGEEGERFRDWQRWNQERTDKLQLAGIGQQDRNYARFLTAIQGMKQANLPGEARTQWQVASDIDPVEAEKYRENMETLEKNLQSNYDLTSQQREATLAKTKQATAQAERLFPFKEQMAQLGIDGKIIANDLAKYQRDILSPLQRQHMELRNKWFEPQAAADINYKNFLAAKAIEDMKLSIEQFMYRQGHDAAVLQMQAQGQALGLQKDYAQSIRGQLDKVNSRIAKIATDYPVIPSSKRDDVSDQIKPFWDEYHRLKGMVGGPNGLAQQVKDATETLKQLQPQPPQVELRGTGLGTPPPPNLQGPRVDDPFAPALPGGRSGFGAPGSPFPGLSSGGAGGPAGVGVQNQNTKRPAPFPITSMRTGVAATPGTGPAAAIFGVASMSPRERNLRMQAQQAIERGANATEVNRVLEKELKKLRGK